MIAEEGSAAGLARVRAGRGEDGPRGKGRGPLALHLV